MEQAAHRLVGALWWVSVIAVEAAPAGQVEVARMIHSSQSRVAKMEAGDPTASLDLLVKSLLAMGASRRDLARAIMD
jgi:hypothetical protein